MCERKSEGKNNWEYVHIGEFSKNFHQIFA